MPENLKQKVKSITLNINKIKFLAINLPRKSRNRKSSRWDIKDSEKRDKIQQISKSCHEYFTTFDKAQKKAENHDTK